ncbi:MAG: hypothetical protein WDW38_000989 [Sanguina aurantia]
MDGLMSCEEEMRRLQVEPEDDKIPVTVEVCLRATSCIAHALIHTEVVRLLECKTISYLDAPLEYSAADHPLLDTHVQSIMICDTDPIKHRVFGPLLFWQFIPKIHVYTLNDEGAAEDEDGEEGVSSYKEWILPSLELHGVWESLYFDTSVKQRLLRYAHSAMLFADAGVCPALISWNRVVLLHGPPGTGKTSLCKALAQKLTIGLGGRYRQGQLVEVNAHSLFSKWFSESGKLVSKLFAKITEMVEEADNIVFVLIDEVESLTSARKAAVSGSEPSDSIRAVNALLTQLDQLKRYPNVMVLTTSNITEAIDVAFVDRADIKAYIGPPTLHARYEILRSTLLELVRAGIISGETGHGGIVLSYPEMLQLAASHGLGNGGAHAAGPGSSSSSSCAVGGGDQTEKQLHRLSKALSLALSQVAAADPARMTGVVLSKQLLEAAASCRGCSGRSLRKMPFLAHAMLALPTPCSATRYISAMCAAAAREREDNSALTEG